MYINYTFTSIFYYRELSFRRGDNLFLLREIDRHWYEGEHHGMIGIFPKNYVEVSILLENSLLSR